MHPMSMHGQQPTTSLPKAYQRHKEVRCISEKPNITRHCGSAVPVVVRCTLHRQYPQVPRLRQEYPLQVPAVCRDHTRTPEEED